MCIPILSIVAHKAGLKVRVLIVESATDVAIVIPNCLYIYHEIPGINAIGTNTATKTSVAAITGPVTCSMAVLVASFGFSPLLLRYTMDILYNQLR